MELFHACRDEDVARIVAGGLRSGSFLTSNRAVADYYLGVLLEDGSQPGLLSVELEDVIREIGEGALAPDCPSIAEPITTALDASEASVHERWQQAAGTWKDSLEIVASIQVTRPIPGGIFRVCELPWLRLPATRMR